MYSAQYLLEGVKVVAAKLIGDVSFDQADGGSQSRYLSSGKLAEPDWRACLRLLAEANRPLIEALQLALNLDDAETVKEILQLEDELYVMECRASSAQARMQGDDMLQRILRHRNARLEKQQQEEKSADQSFFGPSSDTAHTARDQHKPKQQRQQQQQQQQGIRKPDGVAAAAAEASESEGLLAAVDMYKSAAVLARERDLQAEAQAMSRLGHLYKVCASLLDPILLPQKCTSGAAATAGPLLSRSAEERSRDAFLRALLLVDAMPNKISLMMEGWYREARDSISAYQASRAATEEQQREAERAPIREALKTELQALYDAASRGWVELI